MSAQTPETLLKLIILSSNDSIKYHEKLIEEWNKPQDIAKQVAIIIKDIHSMYGRGAFAVLQMMKKNCKHPKKMRDLGADGIVYCMSCNGDLEEHDIMSAKTPTLMKEKILARRKLVKKYAKQKMTQRGIAKKIGCSLSTVEKDMLALRN